MGNDISSHANTARCIIDQKASRKDSSNHQRILKRSRDINREIVEWMSPKRDLTKKLILDACAGVEGSLWAVLNKKGKWLGNEICEADFNILEETLRSMKSNKASAIHGDAHKLSIGDGFADFYLFIFAMNHLRVFDALKEAKRIINDTGKIVICDPGPTYWLQNIIIYQALTLAAPTYKPASQILSSKGDLTNQVTSFQEKTLNPVGTNVQNYVKFLLAVCFGIHDATGYFEEVAKSLKQNSYSQSWWKKQRVKLDVLFWNNLFNSIKKLDLSIVRMGLMPIIELTTEEDKSKNWIVAKIQDCEIKVENFYRYEIDTTISKTERKEFVEGNPYNQVIFGRTLICKKNN